MKASPVGNAALQFLHWIVGYVLRRYRAAQIGHTMIEAASLPITWMGLIGPRMSRRLSLRRRAHTKWLGAKLSRHGLGVKRFRKKIPKSERFGWRKSSRKNDSKVEAVCAKKGSKQNESDIEAVCAGKVSGKDHPEVENASAGQRSEQQRTQSRNGLSEKRLRGIRSKSRNGVGETKLQHEYIPESNGLGEKYSKNDDSKVDTV